MKTITKQILFLICILISALHLQSKNSILQENKITTFENIDSVASWSTNVKVNYVTINNSSIRYLTSGEGDPMILIHSVRTRSDFFQKLIPELSKQYKIYAIDLPGHGGSDIPKGKYDEAFFRDYVSQFIDALQLKNTTIVGESIGATLALTIAANDSLNNIKQVFAINPADYKVGIKRSSLLARIVFTSCEIPGINLVASNAENNLILKRIMRGGLYNKDAIPSDLFKLVAKTRKHKGFGRFFRAFSKHYSSWIKAREMYSNIKIPVTLIYGDHDWSHLEEREANKNIIKNSSLNTLKNTGHFASVDNPNEVLEIILDNKINTSLKTK